MEPNTWTNHGILPVPNDTDAYNVIDPNLLIANNGTAFYLTFDSYKDGIFQLQLEDPLTIEP